MLISLSRAWLAPDSLQAWWELGRLPAVFQQEKAGHQASSDTGQVHGFEHASTALDRADIGAALGGDSHAYRRLVERYQAEIGTQMRRFSRDQETSEQLTHDVFVQAWESLSHYRGQAPWLHWLRIIAVRVGYRYWRTVERRGSHAQITEQEWAQIDGSESDPLEAVEAAELAHALLAQLRPADRLALSLVYLDGYTIAEASAHAGWSAAATKVRLFRARKNLRTIMEQRLK